MEAKGRMGGYWIVIPTQRYHTHTTKLMPPLVSDANVE
jgi:hypothetical protein